MECCECLKYRDGWCRYKGVIDPAAVRPDRNARTCRPAPRHKNGTERPDYGALDASIIATGYLGRKEQMRNQITMDIEEERNKW